MPRKTPSFQKFIHKFLIPGAGGSDSNSSELTSEDIDVNAIIESDVTLDQIERQAEKATEKTDNLLETWKEKEDKYRNLMDKIKSTDDIVEKERLKRKAGRVKNAAESAHQDYELWRSYESSIAIVKEEVTSAMRTNLDDEMDEVVTAIDNEAFEPLIDEIDEEVERAEEISTKADRLTERDDPEQTDPLYAEVERDLAEEELEDTEMHGDDEFGIGIFDDVEEDEEEEEMAGGVIKND